jgi:hypothetical protein
VLEGMNRNPMTCKEFVNSLAAFRDDELGPGDYVPANDHLVSCDACFAYSRKYERTIKLAKESADDINLSLALPEDLVRRIIAARSRS